VISFFTGVYNCFMSLILGLDQVQMYIYIVPVLLFIETPLYMLILLSFMRKIFEDVFFPVAKHLNYYPKVSCLITCYNEREAVVKTVQTLVEQIYSGVIEIFILIDDSMVNKETLDYARSVAAEYKGVFGRKVVLVPKAVVHTDVPDTLKNLIKQRLRWDGDLLFIYFTRYRKVIRPKFFGWKVFLGLFWYNLLFCVIAPVATVLYLVYLICCFPAAYIVAVLIFIYLYYFIVCFIIYTIYLIVVSERKTLDFANIWLVVLFPVYQFLMRFVTTAAFIIEIVLKTHKTSNMAPWWVLKKTEDNRDEN
jgi:cellulose synthase/poly-beta-1,6-N-acetylglucosamine synthase-like glycosyltransferase